MIRSILLLIVIGVTGCASHFDSKSDPEELVIVSTDNFDRAGSRCDHKITIKNYETVACFKIIGKTGIITYKRGDMKSLLHERKHLKNPKKFWKEFKKELDSYTE